MCRWRPKQSKPATDWEARIDDLLAKQASETNPERRASAFSEIQRILAEQSPVIPIVARHVSVAANRRVGNYSPSAIFPFSLWRSEERRVGKECRSRWPPYPESKCHSVRYSVE